MHLASVPCLICPILYAGGHHHHWKFQWATPSAGDQVDPSHSVTNWYAALLWPHSLGRSRVLQTYEPLTISQ